MPFSAGIFSITPVVHFLVNGDEVTKFTSPTTRSDVKLWGGLTISWSRALGASAPSESRGESDTKGTAVLLDRRALPVHCAQGVEFPPSHQQAPKEIP